jgi:glutamate synthase domain-containing protein 3
MTGGRAYLYDPSGRHAAALHGDSVAATRLVNVVADREDGTDRLAELRSLLEDHREAGSQLADRLLADIPGVAGSFWVVEPVAPVVAIAITPDRPVVARPTAAVAPAALRVPVADPSARPATA